MDGPELEGRIADIERRLAALEHALGPGPEGRPAAGDLLTKLAENADRINTQELILVALRLNGRQTKEGIKATLRDWGKAYGSWFEGGNFTGRLVNKNVVKKDGKDSQNQDLYSLTKRGELEADELINKVRGM